MEKYLDLLRNLPQLAGSDRDLIRVLRDEQEIKEWQNAEQLNLEQSNNNPEWAEIGIVFDDPRVLILRDLVEFPGGWRNGYIRVYNRAFLEHGSAGVVVLPEREGQILLMHNFRHATRQLHWEIPRGFGEPGVSAEEQAKAEVKEEIGIDSDQIHLVPLGTLYNNTGLEGNPIDLFLAHVASSGILNEEIGTAQLRWVSIPELEAMIAEGEINDGFTIAAYTRAKLRGLI